MRTWESAHAGQEADIYLPDRAHFLSLLSSRKENHRFCQFIVEQVQSCPRKLGTKGSEGEHVLGPGDSCSQHSSHSVPEGLSFLLCSLMSSRSINKLEDLPPPFLTPLGTLNAVFRGPVLPLMICPQSGFLLVSSAASCRLTHGALNTP